MSGRYARTTTVTVASSRAELENILERYGADRFAYSTEAGRVQIAFRIKGTFVRMDLPMPLLEDREFALTATRQIRSEGSRREAWDQACRQRWRALVLVVKAKLEAVEVGISTLEREFLADTLLPDGSTFGEWAIPQVQNAYLTGTMPPLLLASGS